MAAGHGGSSSRSHVPAKPQHVTRGGIAPECSSFCVPFQKQIFLFRQMKALVIHKKHKLNAKRDNSHFM